jgi:hypothetical protein
VSKQSARGLVRARWVVFALIAVAAVACAVGPAKSFIHHDDARSVSLGQPSSQPAAVTPATRARINAAFAALPLAFEANEGQTDPPVKYMARGNGYTLFLTGSDAVFSLSAPAAERVETGRAGRRFGPRMASQSDLRKTQRDSTAVVRMHLVNGNAQAKVAASDRLPGKINYYIGSDPSQWRTDVGQYARVAYQDVYRGVNMAFHGAQRQLEFDFIVAPGANPEPIELGFGGASKITTDHSGNLILSSSAGDVTLHQPIAYQERDGTRQPVDARFVMKSANEVAFALGPYDRSRELVIDPALSYATYLGGSAEDEAFAIAVDASGNAYVTGQTKSPNFPGALVSAGPTFDVFVSKLAPNGAVIRSTILGGNGDDSGLGVAVNAMGTFVIGNTNSSNFPTTVLAIGPGGGQDAFVAKLDNTSLVPVYVTRIGGSGNDSGNGIAVDSAGNAYIGGETFSANFPTQSPIQAAIAGADDGFVAKLNAAGTALTYSTYLGGSSGDLVTGIALDGSNNAYVTGITVSTDFPKTTGAFQTSQAGADDGFVTAIKADGSALIYSTFLGGSGTDDALGIAVDSAGEAYVTGNTDSSNFPTASAAQATLKGAKDVFITKLKADGSGLVFSTYFGGTLDDSGTGIALDSFDDVYVTGRTLSSDYPTGGSAFQGSSGGGSDAFVSELSNTGFLVYSSYLGGTLNENSVSGNNTLAPLGAIAVDSTSSAYLAGETNSTSGFPATPSLQASYGGGLADGFVAKVGAAPADFSIAISPTSISTTSGQTTPAITVTVSSVNAAYGSAVTVSCGGKPSKAACNFSTTSVTPGATPATSNLTISTNGTTGNGMLVPPLNRRSQIFYALLLPIGGLALFGVGLGSGGKKLPGFFLLTLVVTGLLVLPACGGGSGGGGGGGGGGGSNTPPGSYTITVSGAANGVTHSQQLTLKVN